MTTGVPIYLVSACNTPEELVAAYRRYADRAGLFVPCAQPLPAGKRGRVALTLADGGVMIEGEAEILQSSSKPQGLHGRAGMTLKFVELDDLSKVVLGELEKARLALKPAPPSVPPRPAQVPAEPRAKPPAPGGRIDATNALAECVVIGDPSTLREMAPPGGEAPKAGQKFVVPPIAAAPRTKAPTTPPKGPAESPTKVGVAPQLVQEVPTKIGAAPVEPAKTAEPAKPAEAKPAEAKPAEAKPAEPPKVDKATTLGMPKLDKDPAKPAVGLKQTMMGMPALRTATQPFGVPTTTPAQARAQQQPRRPHTPSSPPMPRQPTPVVPLPIVKPPAADAKPAGQVPLAPKLPAGDAARPGTLPAEIDLAEPTESTPVPTAPPEAPPLVGQKQRGASLGVAIVSAEPPPPPAAPIVAPEQPKAPVNRSGGMRASEIMAAIPEDDWTMSPDASAPTVLPSSEKIPTAPPLVIEPKTPPKGPPSGDWTIQADPSAADGWTPPTKVPKAPPPAPVVPATGNPVHAIPEKALTAVAWEDRPTNIGEKIEIDPTLMEPVAGRVVEKRAAEAAAEDEETGMITDSPPVADAMPLAPAPIAPPPPAAPPMQPGPQPQSGSFGLPFANPLGPPPVQQKPPPQPLAAGMMPPPTTGNPMAFAATVPAPVYPQRQPTDGASWYRDSEQVARYPSGETNAIEKLKRRKLFIIATGAALGVIAGIIIVVMVIGGGKKTAAATSGSGSGSGSAPVKQPVTNITQTPKPDAAVAETPPPPPAKTTCEVSVNTVPEGATVSLEDGKPLATTPAKLQLPCRSESKLLFKKARYASATKSVTPTDDTKLDAVHLARQTFLLKVTSTPAGASITVGGRPQGVTPTTIRLPAFESTRVTLVKDGFATDTEAVTAKTNGQPFHVTLKPKKHH